MDADTRNARLEVAVAQAPYYLHAYAHPESWETLQKEWKIKLLLVFAVE